VLQADCQHLLNCPHCGVLNGRSVKVCWGCEAELPAIPPSTFTFDDEQGIGANPELSGRSSRSADSATADAARDSAEPRFDESSGAADASFPVLTSAVDDDHSTTAPLVGSSATAARRRILVALFALLIVAGTGAYFHIRDQITENQGVSVMSNSAFRPNRSAVAVAPALGPVAAESDGPGQRSGLTRSMAIDATPAAAVEASPPAVRSPIVEPDPRGVAKPEPLSDARAIRPARPGSRDTRPGTGSAAPTERHAATSNDSIRSPNAAAAALMPAPSRSEPVRQAPGSLGPCTAAVAALGLCTAPSIQPKEPP
jgi:hypothetical protein